MAQIGPRSGQTLTITGRIRTPPSQPWSNQAMFGSSSVGIGPNLAEFGPILAHSGPILVKVGRIRATRGSTRDEFG